MHTNRYFSKTGDTMNTRHGSDTLLQEKAENDCGGEKYV